MIRCDNCGEEFTREELGTYLYSTLCPECGESLYMDQEELADRDLDEY